MPTYEYACTDCGQHIEVVLKMSDAPLHTCGACGGRLRKVFSPIGIVFKGSGFYRTDSRSGSGPGERKAAASAAGSGSSDSGSSGGSDTGSSGSSGTSGGSEASGSSGKTGSTGKAAESA